MAHSVEPMDIDCINSDFDNKENTFHHNNAQPCTEKGYEELDVSELNMKLRYSVTPAASPMSKSFTSCIDNRTLDLDDSLNSSCNNGNLTRSLNSTMTKNDSVVKSLKSLPLQSLPTDQPVERSVSVLRQLDSTITAENNNITVTVSSTNDIEENVSLPSSSSSHTPEATTPTKDVPKSDGGSPIMRGLKSVFNMFRSSQSPIPPPDNENTTPKQLTPTSTKRLSSEPRDKGDPKTVLASTPIAAHRDRDGNGSKRNSPYKESIIFNDDLEKELQWKDETTILFSEEKIPIHKLFYPQRKNKVDNKTCEGNTGVKTNLDTTVEYMDISCHDSAINDRTMTEVSPGMNKNELHVANESDSEFLDCETDTNVPKTSSYMLEKQVEELSNENVSKQDLIKDVKISADNQEIIQQIDDIVNNTLNVSIPIECSNLEANEDNLCTSSLSQNISMIQATCDNVSKCEEILNTEEVLAKAAQEPNSEIMSQTFNHDATMTLDHEEVKEKTISNMLEVSTLESHTQSLSSLIESLDNTKTIEKENNTVCNDNDLKVETPEETVQVPQIEPQSSNVTITLNNEESDKSETTTQQFLDIPDSMHKTFHNTNATNDIVNQEEIIKENNFDTSENSVLNNTMNITHEINKDDAPTRATLQEPEINAHKEFTVVDQVTTNAPEIVQIIESPADIPLPDDEVIEENLNSPPDESIVVTGNVLLPVVDKSIAEIEVNNIIEDAVGAITKLNQSNMTEMPQDKLNLENRIESHIQGEIVPGKEETNDISMLSEVSNDLESEVKNTDEIKNVENTLHGQTSEIIESTVSVGAVPNVINQSVLEDIDMMVVEAPVGHANESTSNKVSSLFENTDNNISSSENNQEGQIQNHNQSNINSILLPENHITSSILACEEILDKNREISEVILTEQKIDKLQHECDVVLSFAESKDEASDMAIKENEQKSIPGDLNATFEKVELDADQVKVNQLVDVIKSVTETKSQNNTQKSENIIEDLKCSVDEVKNNADQEITPIKDINAIKNDKLDDKNINNSIEQENIQTEVYHVKINEINTANKSMTMENDGNIKHDAYRDTDKELQEERLHNQNVATVTEKSAEKLIKNDDLLEKMDLTKADDEIVISENNSPYVSIAADLDKVSLEKPLESFEEIENPFTTNTEIPSSPPIASKGYNFNFDDIDDPFATKVKVRMSPTPDTPNKPTELKIEDKKLQRADTFKKDINKNRRKSQPKPKLSSTKKPFNATFDCSVSPSDKNGHQSKTDVKSEKHITDVNVEEQNNMSIDFSNDMVCNTTTTIDVNKNYQEITTEKLPVDNIATDVNKNTTVSEEKPVNNKVDEENKHSTESITAASNEIKTTSSSEQSTYYSAGTSSSESNNTRNVFNLPEIDDMNFNPFATKTKIRQSPPRGVSMDNPFETKNKVLNSPDSSVIMQQGHENKNTNNATTSEKNLEDKMETEPMEKDSSGNISNITSSSADKDTTIREVNTEDEDTIEGPFLEAEEVEEYKQSQIDVEGTDMMQFNELPTQDHDENADGELFIDAEAFEFLLNQNKSNVVADSGKESLFLKFDPLFAKRMSSDSVVAALSRAQKRQSTPTRTPRQQRNSPMSVAGPSTMNLNFEADPNATEDLNTTVTKPMMVVTPAVNPTAAIRKSITPTRTNRRSITFTSPAMAVIDRLLSLSANNSLVEQESTIPQVSREQNEAELALTQLREVLAEKEIQVYNLRSESKELKDRLSALESQMKVLEAEGQQRLKKINDLNDKLAEKTKMNKSMAVVVEEYERTIASLIAETEQDKKRHAEERIALMNERDEQTAHLASMEVSFNDLHSKYEKSKQVIMNYKANEETYKQSLKEFEENVAKMQKNYELLKQHATSKLNHANEELQKINRAHEAEVLKFNAMIKRKELHITSLEETLAQKTKANEELTAICDELINKVG